MEQAFYEKGKKDDSFKHILRFAWDKIFRVILSFPVFYMK